MWSNQSQAHHTLEGQGNDTSLMASVRPEKAVETPATLD